jgi:hypothetical protein
MNQRGPKKRGGKDGKGEFSILPTRVKSGRVFAPRHKKGISK